MKSIFPAWMPNADIASACFVLGVLLFFVALGMSGEVTKQNKHEYRLMWYGSNAVGLLSIACWIAMIGFIGGWL